MNYKKYIFECKCGKWKMIIEQDIELSKDKNAKKCPACGKMVEVEEKCL